MQKSDATHSMRSDWLHREWRRLGLWLPVSLGGGIAWYFGLDGPTKAQSWLLASAFFALAAMLGWFGMRRFMGYWPFVMVTILGMALGAVGLGGGLAAIRLQAIAAPILPHNLEQTTISGVIEDMLVQPDSLKLTLGTLRIDPLNPSEKPDHIRITTRRYRMEKAEEGDKRRQAHFDIGDRVILRATLFPPPSPASPGQFDYARYFYFQQIGAIGFSNDRITILHKATEASGFDGWLARFRLHLSERIRQQIAERNGRPSEGAIATAMMTGQQNAIPRPVNDAMRVSGLSHVLSISGLHLALAAGIVFVTLRMLFLLALPPRWRDKGAKKMAAFGALLSALAYLAVSGYPVAAERSFIMIAFVLVAVMLDRQALGMRSLAVAALLLLLWQPESLLSASFQLSFAATAAIIAWAEAGTGLLMRWKSNEGVPPWLRTLTLYVGGSLATSFVASMITAPLIMMSFQQFNSYGLISNLILSPLISFWIMPLIVISFVALPLGLEAWPLQGVGWGIGQMIRLADWVSGLPYASLSTPTLPPLGLALVAGGGLWLLLWRTGRVRLMGIPAIAIGLWLAWQQPHPEILISRDGKQVAAQLPGGEWRMLTGSRKNLTAQQWLEVTGRKSYAVPEETDALCDKVHCRVADILLRFDPKPPRAYKPRPPKKPDSELTEAQLKRRQQSREKSAAKRAEKLAAMQAQQAEQTTAVDASLSSFPASGLVLDIREKPADAGAALRITRQDILAARGMILWREGAIWHVRTVAEQQGRWPWAIANR